MSETLDKLNEFTEKIQVINEFINSNDNVDQTQLAGIVKTQLSDIDMILFHAALEKEDTRNDLDEIIKEDGYYRSFTAHRWGEEDPQQWIDLLGVVSNIITIITSADWISKKIVASKIESKIGDFKESLKNYLSVYAVYYENDDYLVDRILARICISLGLTYYPTYLNNRTKNSKIKLARQIANKHGYGQVKWYAKVKEYSVYRGLKIVKKNLFRTYDSVNSPHIFIMIDNQNNVVVNFCEKLPK